MFCADLSTKGLGRHSGHNGRQEIITEVEVWERSGEVTHAAQGHLSQALGEAREGGSPQNVPKNFGKRRSAKIVRLEDLTPYCIYVVQNIKHKYIHSKSQVIFA